MPSDHTRARRSAAPLFAPGSAAPVDAALDPLSSASPIMRVSGPAALVQAVPYLIGFHPAESVVVVGLRDGVLVVTARLDLAPPGRDTGISHAVHVLLRGGVNEVVTIVYSDEPLGRDAAGALGSLASQIDAGAARLIDTLVVCRDRWRSLLCDDDACCPPEGRRLDEHTSEFAAAATFAGVVAHPDRDSLAAILQPGDPASRHAVAELLTAATIAAAAKPEAGRRGGRDVRATRRLFAAARAADDECSHYSTQPSDHEVVQMALWLADIDVRDSVWMAIDDGRLDGRPLWAALARRLPSPHDAAPAFLYGWAAWRAGNGAMASIAARRAVDADPGYTAADLLLAALSRGIDPRTVPRLRRARG